MTPTQASLRQDRTVLGSELRQAGAEIRGTAFKCPGHDDQHASGSIYCDVDGIWRGKCHVCGYGGDVFDLCRGEPGGPWPTCSGKRTPTRPNPSGTRGQVVQDRGRIAPSGGADRPH